MKQFLRLMAVLCPVGRLSAYGNRLSARFRRYKPKELNILEQNGGKHAAKIGGMPLKRVFHVCRTLRSAPRPLRGLAMVFVCIYMLWITSGQAQTGDIPDMKPLQVGDTIPASTLLPTMLNHPNGQSTMGEYRGKWLILDFWATYCPACINAMPHLYELQQQFNDDLNIVLVSSEKAERVGGLLEKSPIARGTNFPFVVEDIQLHQFFPHRIIPHEIWIDPDGVVKAITSHTEVTRESVAAMISGRAMPMPVKKDNIGWYFAQRYDEIKADTSVLFQSTLRKYNAGSPTTGYFHTDTMGNNVWYKHVSFYNQLPLKMYYSLFMRCVDKTRASNLNPHRIKVEIESPEIEEQYANANLELPFYPRTFPYGRWQSRKEYIPDNLFNYDFTLSDFIIDTAFMRAVFDDLDRYFPIKAKVEKRLVDCMVIYAPQKHVATSLLKPDDNVKSTALPTKNGEIIIQNRTIKDLVDIVKMFKAMPIIDETGIESTVSITIDFKNSPHYDHRYGLVTNMYPFDTHVFEQQLNRYGLDLSIEKRMVDMLIITD